MKVFCKAQQLGNLGANFRGNLNFLYWIIYEVNLEDNSKSCEFIHVSYAGLWQVPKGFNIDEGLVQAIQAYENSSSAVLVNSQLGEFFKTTVR